MSSGKALSQKGSALISFIIIIPFLMLVAALYMDLAVNSLNVAFKDQGQTQSQLAADAAADFALEQINIANTWGGTAGLIEADAYNQVEIQNANNVRTTMEVTVADPSPTSKVITAIGRTFRPAVSTEPSSTKRIIVELRPVTSGPYSVVTGVGGLYMSNSAKIIGGDVIVNGEITMSNTSQIGLATNPVDVRVAHQNCPVPPDVNYPRLCAGGENGEPVTLGGSSRIYGEVMANNQTNGSRMSNPGLVSGSVTPGPLPTHDRAAQAAAVTLTEDASIASCSGSTVKSWPANYKITGDVTISGSCQVTITGNVWITGTLMLSNSAQIRVSDGLSTTMPDVMVDGAIARLRNSSALVSNSSGMGLRLLTYWSRATCSPDCADVTGADLYNTRGDETIVLDNIASAPESILYAKWSRVSLKNSGGVGALVGQTINMSNSATVTFGSSTNVGGTTFWVIDGYRRGY